MNRYELHEQLGRGGMACVYRATDRVSGRQVALKQLMLDAEKAGHDQRVALFEREFHMLAQLSHPHVIAVYDYGVEGAQPYYTMELLDGGDLHAQAPHPWRKVCRLFFQVCSSLALLHSRRLLHRDISPRNIRCTRDGAAKLIDFGALAPMSAGGSVLVGTPAFSAPETVHRLALDASTDLYSLGVTLYYALTAHLPYPARTFAEVISAWTAQVAPPSSYIEGIPAALDELVMGLINLEPALRPQHAFDVMQRLAAIAGLSDSESEAVPRAYLATPSLVGRDAPLDHMRQTLLAGSAGRGGSLVIATEPGLGRSRLLDAFALEAKTLGFSVLRATASPGREPYDVLRALLRHLLELGPSPTLIAETPELFDAEQRVRAVFDPGLESTRVNRLFHTCSRERPLLVAVDDVHRLDAASSSVLAALLDSVPSTRVCVVLTVDSASPDAAAVEALTRRCERLSLSALSSAQTASFLGSLFGEVPHIGTLATEVHKVALGNPQQTLDIAQHLIDRNVIRYAAGTWTLPPKLSAGDLPLSSLAALRARAERCSPLARLLGECLALAFYDELTLTDFRALARSAAHAQVDAALSELEQVQALVRDGARYLMANRLWSEAFTGQLSETSKRERHAALADIYEVTDSMATTHHCFLAGLEERGLDRMLQRFGKLDQMTDHIVLMEQNVSKLSWCQLPAIETAKRLGRSRRQVHEIRRWYYTAVITHEDPIDTATRDEWLHQLLLDSGLDAYRREHEATPASERLSRALQGALERYQATPEHERVYNLEEAIRRLAEYVALSVAIGGRAHDMALLRSLPGLLEPFVALSPALLPIFINATATCCCIVAGQFDQARVRWIEALDKFDQLSERELTHVNAMRGAIAYAICMCEAQLGLPAAFRWVERLEHDPAQRVGALHLRKVLSLEQCDWAAAGELQRQAEIVELRSRNAPMFRELLVVELSIYIKARDLNGLQQVLAQTKPLAARYPGWLATHMVGEAYRSLVAGDYAAARQQFERCLELTQPDAQGQSDGMPAWVAASAGLSEALLYGKDPAQACARARAALQVCETNQIGSLAFDLIRALALAEGKLGEASGAQRLEALIEKQLELGVSGVHLGCSYEARAQIALWQGHTRAFEHFARLTAHEYRHGVRSPLGARYEALINQASRYGHLSQRPRSLFARSQAVSTSELGVTWRSLLAAQSGSARAQLALDMICSACSAEAGQLYLVSSHGLVWAAASGAISGASSVETVQRYLDDTLRQCSAADDAETRLSSDPDQVTTQLRISGANYQPCLISCHASASRQVVGVAMLAGPGVKTASAAQLLEAIAEHLLSVGDDLG